MWPITDETCAEPDVAAAQALPRSRAAAPSSRAGIPAPTRVLTVFARGRQRPVHAHLPGALAPTCRLPNRPVLNTPVVSTTVHSEGAPLPGPLERPVLVQLALLETEERSKPACVFWNHSIT